MQYPTENGSRPHLEKSLRGLKLTQQHEDFEMKKGLICLLSSLSCDVAAWKVMTEEKVIRSLLSFVTRNDKIEAHQWNPAQFEELQLLVSLLYLYHGLYILTCTCCTSCIKLVGVYKTIDNIDYVTKKLVGVYLKYIHLQVLYTPTSFFTISLQPFNMELYRTIISTLI